jgi:hypothetical protein
MNKKTMKQIEKSDEHFMQVYYALGGLLDEDITAKKILQLYEVDYTDPTNYIYLIYGTTQFIDIKNYKIDGEWKYKEILELYRREYHQKQIIAPSSNITSIGIYPFMIICELSGNKLTSFPKQPKMKECYLDGNNLTSFNVQPKLKKWGLTDNLFETSPPYMT